MEGDRLPYLNSISKFGTFKCAFATSTSLSELDLRHRRFILLIQTKVISMSYIQQLQLGPTPKICEQLQKHPKIFSNRKSCKWRQRLSRWIVKRCVMKRRIFNECSQNELGLELTLIRIKICIVKTLVICTINS